MRHPRFLGLALHIGERVGMLQYLGVQRAWGQLVAVAGEMGMYRQWPDKYLADAGPLMAERDAVAVLEAPPSPNMTTRHMDRILGRNGAPYAPHQKP